MNKLIPAMIALTLIAGTAQAKLPPPSEEAQAAAAAAKDKAAWGEKMAAYQLCLRQNKLAARYLQSKGAQDAKPPAVEVPPCTDPGPYVATAPVPPAAGTTAATTVPAAPASAPANAAAAPAAAAAKK